jgi:hypothetical protein
MSASHIKNPAAKHKDIQRQALMAELQKLLAQLENPQLTREQLDQLKWDVADCQKRYVALGYSAT